MIIRLSHCKESLALVLNNRLGEQVNVCSRRTKMLRICVRPTDTNSEEGVLALLTITLKLIHLGQF